MRTRFPALLPLFHACSLMEGSQQQATLLAFQMTLCCVTLEEAEPSKTVTDDGKELSVMDLDQDLLRHTVQGSWHWHPHPWHTTIHTLVYMKANTEDDDIPSLSLSLYVLFRSLCRGKKRVNNLCVRLHVCADVDCVCLLRPISRHRVVTPSLALGNTTVSFTIKASFCLFASSGYRLSLLYKALLAFFLFRHTCRQLL